jgi:hypothetical protein
MVGGTPPRPERNDKGLARSVHAAGDGYDGRTDSLWYSSAAVEIDIVQ